MVTSGNLDPEIRRHKVVVLGAGEAGKSTLIGFLCDSALNVDVRGRTVGLDHGLLRIRNRRISLVGVPGQDRFVDSREVILRGAEAAIWVHRPSQPAHPETIRLLRKFDLPYLLYLNHHQGASETLFELPTELDRPRELIRGCLLRPHDRNLGRVRLGVLTLLDSSCV